MNDYEKPQRRMNAGFSSGLIGGLIISVVFLIFTLIDENMDNRTDSLVFLIQLAVFFFIGQSAAERQYYAQIEDPEPLEGVIGAGKGAALIVCTITWIFIIIRGIVRDSMGVFIFTDPVGLFFVILINFLIAIAIGTWAGKIVEKRYRLYNEY